MSVCVFVSVLSVCVCVCLDSTRLLDVLMQESRLYLIFEFLSMDLEKYLDSIPAGQYMDSMLVKVCPLLGSHAGQDMSSV